MKAVEGSGGATILASPSVITANGMQAQVQIVDMHETPSGEKYSTGPVLNFMPTISPDGQSVQMVIVAQLNYPLFRTKQK
jgi:type II secretory pathway component GspD/PulD (secretin)